MNNFFDNRRILDVIWNRKFHFIGIGLIAIVLSAIFSGPGFITPKFKSTARIYPTNLAEFSEESETEQMLEIVNSIDIKFRMFDAFDLDKVYKINKSEPLYRTYMLDMYGTNVSASKTEFETVEIKVLDKDPERASAMCDSIIRFYNEKVQEMHRTKYLEMVEISKKEMDLREQEIQTINKQIHEIQNEYGILSYHAQIESISKTYMKSIDGKSASKEKQLKELYENFQDKGLEIDALESKLTSIYTAFNDAKILYDNNLSEYEKVISYSHVVEHPFPAEKKAYPIRWLIVFFSVLSAVFLSFLVFLFLDFSVED